MNVTDALEVLKNDAGDTQDDVIAAARTILSSPTASKLEIFKAATAMRRIRTERYAAEMASRETPDIPPSL
jgi:hypothetical protein